MSQIMLDKAGKWRDKRQPRDGQEGPSGFFRLDKGSEERKAPAPNPVFPQNAHHTTGKALIELYHGYQLKCQQ